MDTLNDQLLKSRDRGAVALLVAVSLLLLLAVAAVALDISAAFNERNQDQNAGDNGVMAGGIDKADELSDQQIVNSSLDIVRANLTADFPGGANDPNWIALWRGCVDSGNPNWKPLPEPAAWGGGTLDCISQTTALLRVRVPDQLTPATFGSVLGSTGVNTHAISIAKAAIQQTAPPLVPFGIAGSAGSGELCLSSTGGGIAYPPCTGPQAGSFGSIISPLFGDFGSFGAQCSGSTGSWLERNIVFGIDHEIEPWPGASLVVPPAAWPGPSNNILAMPNTERDDCALDPDGNAAPLDGININTMKIDSGYPNPNLTRALVSDQLYDGTVKSRLQQGSNSKRIIQSKVMGSVQDWDLDNVGPWGYLNNTSLIPECQQIHYATLSDTAARNTAFDYCMQNADPTETIFDTTITSSPRFVWVPQYVYELPGVLSPGGGTSWMPIRKFRAAYIGGVFFNCNAGGCDLVFYPDQTVTTTICDPTPGGCQTLSANQFSAWLLPDTALPMSVFDDFNAAFDNLEAELFQ